MTRPIVFIQYIAAIAIVEAIQSYGQGYEKIPVKIKWPNDICELPRMVFPLSRANPTKMPRTQQN